MSGYIGVQPVPQATMTHETFPATAGQTSFATAGYTPNYLQVFLNGVKLVGGTDYTATNGSDVVLTSGAADGDTLEVLAYTAFEVLNQNFTGGVTVDNDGATVLTVDRATSDGTIIDVQKDGTTVGSIGTNTGAIYFGNGDTGILCAPATNIVSPWDTNTNTANNGNLDLGYSGGRWKNLYLSGGVYLGGTGSANLLDDYEEGTWTPVLVNGPAISILYSARYVKVGNTCTATVFLTLPTNSDPDSFSITLPFASANISSCYWSGSIGYNTLLADQAVLVSPSSNTFNIRRPGSGGIRPYSEYSGASFIATMTYQTA